MHQDISSQVLKGILQGIILMILTKQPEYGYGLSKQMDRYDLNNVPKGTIYPLLTTMEKRGFIEGKRQPSEVGPTRKYYYITKAGENEKNKFIQEWEQLQKSVNKLIKEDSHD
ncbi:PadR family transcriptional regulator [Ligilactobacillus pobuzihii]|uniref:PadR family transcriptional regulator n=1 Tax=Ligilactobacillus pobuzihii TaxID=449659 RepID=UPI0019D26780|nr:PadR family transcriptional regulator [Ligilactobacillus pobuzihii]MBN7274231.1 PadR family transcriptional regulator [Ligilactobacillus pobuzihii]